MQSDADSMQSSITYSSGSKKACVDFYFIETDGSTFKVYLPSYLCSSVSVVAEASVWCEYRLHFMQARRTFDPYFYLDVKDKFYPEVESYLRNTHGQYIASIQAVSKEELTMVS
jgi:hypothetical protein